MTGSQDNDAGAADLAARGQGCAGGEGGSSAIPGRHPGALAAGAPSPGRLIDVGAGAGGAGDTRAAPQPGVLGDGPDTRYSGEGSAGGAAGAVGNLDASSPATPEGDAISRGAAIAAAEVFNGPVSDSDFLNGQSTAAQQIVAALLSLPPQPADLRGEVNSALPLIADYLRAPHMDAKREIDERARAWIDGSPDPWVAELSARAEKAEAERDNYLAEWDKSIVLMNEAGELLKRALAERDAIAAAAFEAAARLCWAEVRRREDQLSGPVHGEIQTARWQAGKLEADHLATKIEALTPTDAKAALDAMIEAAAMTECAAFSAGYEAGERDGKPAALTAQPVAQEPVATAPEEDDRWCAGSMYALTRLCAVLKVDHRNVDWDGSDGGLDEEADALIWRILRANDPDYTATPAPVEAGLRRSINDLLDCWDMWSLDEIKAHLTAALRAQSAPVGETVPAGLLNLAFAVQYGPNCPSPWLVRLCGNSGGAIDLKPYVGIGVHRSTLTKDILGFGKTFAEAAAEALAKRRPMAILSKVTPPPAWLDGEGGAA